MSIPEGWREVKLGDILTLNYGKSLKTENRKFGSVPVYSSAGLTGYHDTALVDSKGIIVGRKGTIGKVFYSSRPFCCIDTAYYILPNDKIYNFNYLFYLLTTLRLDNLNEDSAVPGLNRETAYQQYVLFPPLPEQKAIAGMLSSLDDKIDLLHRQNKTLEIMAETLFRQWFIEEAQDDLETMCIQLGDMINIYDSQRIPLSKMQRDQKKITGEIYPYYGAAKIIDYIDSYIFDGDYLLIGEDGTVQNELGYPILQRVSGKFWVNNHAHVVSAQAPYSNFFIWCLLSRTNIEKIITGAVQPKINQENLKKLSFPQFDFDLVSKFTKISNSYINKIDYNLSQIQTLEKLRDTLLPRLMRGEIRVQYENTAS